MYHLHMESNNFSRETEFVSIVHQSTLDPTLFLSDFEYLVFLDFFFYYCIPKETDQGKKSLAQEVRQKNNISDCRSKGCEGDFVLFNPYFVYLAAAG